MNITIRNVTDRYGASDAARIGVRFAEEFPLAERGAGQSRAVLYSSRFGGPTWAVWWTRAGNVVVYQQAAP